MAGLAPRRFLPPTRQRPLSPFLAGIDRMLRAQHEEYPTLPEYTLGYILRTGGSWRSPIRNFRLVVDKGSADNIVSFCGDGIRQISPTRFEVRRTNWRLTRDLRILIIAPRAAQ